MNKFDPTRSTSQKSGPDPTRASTHPTHGQLTETSKKMDRNDRVTECNVIVTHVNILVLVLWNSQFAFVGINLLADSERKQYPLLYNNNLGEKPCAYICDLFTTDPGPWPTRRYN